jgi:Leucine-rich repeat (LRR) protein
MGMVHTVCSSLSSSNSPFKNLHLASAQPRQRRLSILIVLLGCVGLFALLPQRLSAQLYFFDGFTDAAVTTTWYNTPQGLGSGFAGPDFAGQNLIVLAGRHAVVYGTMPLNGGTITVQAGGQLTVVGAGSIAGGGTLTINNGGILRLDGTGGVAALGAITYNAGATLLYTGTTFRDVFNGGLELPAAGMSANVVFHNTSANGVRLNGYVGLPFNGSVTVSSGTMQLLGSTVNCNGTFAFQGNGTCTFATGTPSITFNSSADIANGTFNAVAGIGSIVFAGTGGVSGNLRVTSGAGSAGALGLLDFSRSGSLAVASSFGVRDITLGTATSTLSISSGMTLTAYSNITTAMGSNVDVSGTLIYSDGLGAVNLNGNLTVNSGGLLQVQALGFGGSNIRINDGGRLRTSETFTTGAAVFYSSGSATLEYFGTNVLAPPGLEFPTMMRGSVTVAMSGAGQLQLDGTRTILGTLSVAPSGATQPVLAMQDNSNLTLKGSILTSTGAPTFGILTPDQATVSITIDSTISAPISNFSIRPFNSLTGNAFVRGFTMNRPTTLSLQNNLVVGPESDYPNVITTTLSLQRGIIVPGVGNRVILLSSNATSLIGGSTGAYVQGTLQRTLRTSASTYNYPVGAGGQFMLFSILNPVTVQPTADATPGVAITPQINFTGGSSATLGQIASFAPSGRVWTADLTTITGVENFRVQLADTSLVASSVLGVAGTASGDYSILPSTLFSNIRLTATAPVSLLSMGQSRSFRVGNTTPGPEISSVTPTIVGSGATVLITGTNFIEVTRVAFGTTTAASYNVVSPTQIAAVLPASVVNDPNSGINSVRVNLSITAQGGSTASVTTLTFVLPPTVLNFSPVIGTPGTPVRIIGTRLGGTLYNIPPTVTFGGIPAQSVTITSPTEIIAIVPRNGTTGTLRVSTPGGTVATISTFTFVPPPRITEIVPSIAPEGALVTVNGTGFLQVIEVRFGGVRTQATINSANRLTALISTGATGVVEIFTPAGVITSQAIFTFAPPPLVTGASPLVVGTGGTIQVQGFGFVASPNVQLGTVTASNVSVASIRTMNVVVPTTLAPGRYPISVTTPGGSTTGSFVITVVPSPIVTGFAPPSGTTGTIVQIFGRNFTASTVANVRIAGVTAANFRVISDSLIVAETARISSGGTIAVTALGGTSIAPGTFANIAPEPVITGFEPTSATSGTLVRVFGSNFNDANVLQIVNDNISLDFQSFRVVTNGQVTFIMPENATSGTILIATSGGPARSAIPITYLPPPSISQLEPTFGLPGSTFTIRGNNFNGTRQVILGATPALRVREDSPSQLTVTIDPASPLGFDLPVTIVAAQGTTRVNNLFSVVTEIQADSLALVEIYRRTVGSGWRENANWLTLRPIAQWTGVTVATAVADSAIRGRVIGLSLPQNNMQGSLPVALQFLTALRRLNWSGNPLSGAFPPYIGNFRRLEELNFGGMRLTGTLSDSLGNLARLRVLNVSANALTGRIPRRLESVLGLEELNLSANAFADSIPTFLGNLTNLRVLRLNNNQLIGTIPMTFSPSLREFDISSNRITGTIPDNFRSLRSLTVLAAANNQLTGALPIQTIRPLDSLRTLNLGGNRFTGQIPPELSLLRRLRFLSLRANQLDGAVPDVLSGLDSLETLWLDSNRLTAALPATFENFQSLARLNIAGNRITVLPNLLRVRLLNNLNVAANSLDFSSLETNALIDTLTIVPQDSIGERQRIGGIISIPVRLAVNTGGSANRYQWFRQTSQGEVAVSPVLRDSAFIFPFTSASSGTYSCRVTNTLPELRSLTLFSRPIRVDSIGVPSPPRDVPEPQFPIDSITNIVTTASLSWTRTTDASIYDVQLLSGRDTLNVSVTDTAYRLPGVRFETLYYWRVRGRNISGVAAWSVWNPFVTVPRNTVIAAFIPRFPRTPVGDEALRNLTLTSNTSANISIISLTVTDTEGNNFELTTEINNNFPLQAGSTISLPVKFVPKSAGRKVATVRIIYRFGTSATIQPDLIFTNIVQGDATPIKIVDTDFDLVRVNRRTLASVLIINRLPRVPSTTATAQSNVITIRNVEILGSQRNSFSRIAFQSPMYLGAGDTTALIIRCEPSLVGRLSATIKVVADVANTAVPRDSSFGTLRANAILADTSDFFAEVALRPARGQEKAAPGSAVQLEVYYTRAKLPPATTTIPPIIFGSMRFDRNVLALIPNGLSENLPNSAPLNTISRTQIFGSPRVYPSRERAQPRQDSVLIDSIACRAVAGNITQTPLQMEQLSWGRAGSRLTKVFIEESAATHTFTAEVSRAGGTRLITPAVQGTLLTAIQPNPANAETDIVFKIVENTSITLDILDIQGQVVKRIRSGEIGAGEYTTRVRLTDLPSGSYLVRLKTMNETLTEKLQVVR